MFLNNINLLPTKHNAWVYTYFIYKNATTMKNIFSGIISFLLLFFISGCSCKKLVTGSNGLPPATQTGANTFGFLLNGQPWVPKGWTGGSANLSLDIDFSYRNGIFNIAAYKLISGHRGQSFGMALE